MLRIEHLLYGQTGTPSLTPDEPAAAQVASLEKRFSVLTSHIRVYADLLKIYKSHPDFFHASPTAEPPSQLPADAVQAIVLSSASSFHSTLSYLTAIKDCTVPDPAESASLIAQTDRMRALKATQMAQAAEVAELRARSERLIRTWYEASFLPDAQALADLEGRMSMAERGVRRAEHEREAAKEL
ncbi:nuclear distribution protein [Geosmithia morbida]|uniref:Nuclear distribution protein n=1 Tax=Geosmithia morbida TaxID=1094350 RepID=A0A9P5D307_9HYPO|nr:nuclear distribution protein [Geosmithia morbida]KAF4124427.1 nuclear distribution protein [Geosmithia morbida]